MKELFGWLLFRIYYPFSKNNIKLLSVYFHDPSPTLFETIVKWFVKKNYKFLSLTEFIAIVEKTKQFNGKAVYFSFDDGWRSNLELLPIIEKFNIPITIFISTEPLKSGNFWWEYVIKEYGSSHLQQFKEMSHIFFVEEIMKLKEKHHLIRSALTIDELKLISSHPLVSIQSHTVTHPILTNCSDNHVKFELEESKLELEQFTNNKVRAFSYPNGSYNTREIETLKCIGYQYAFTTEVRHLSISEDLFQIPRMCVNTTGGLYENLAKILGVWQKMIFFKK